MNAERFSAIAHTGISFWNPVSEEALQQIARDLPLNPTSRVLDVGCGTGELLLRIVEQFGCAGLGIDKSEFAISTAQQQAKLRLPDADLELKCESFQADSLPQQSFDLAICIGSTHAISNLEQTMAVLSTLVKPGGLILLGDGYWQQDPPAEYLDFLQCSAGDLQTHEGNLSFARKHSLQVLHTHQTTAAEWRQYEDTYAANVLEFIAQNPQDPDAAAMENRIRPWHDAHLKWGKDTLGFALYLLQV